MFQVKRSDVPTSLRATSWVVLASLALAEAAGVWVWWDARGGPSAAAARAAAAPLIVAGAGVAFVALLRLGLRTLRDLRRVKMLAHDILASMEQGVVTTDTAGRITSINPGAARLLGADAGCVGRPSRVLDASGVPVDALARLAAERHESVRDREYSADADGRPRTLLASAYELKDDRGEPLGAILHVRDVTERMRMIEQMWRLERIAGLSTLATGLHHEIKNPLTALSLHVQLADEGLRAAGAPAAVAELLGVVKAEVRRLNDVLERFRSFANLERLDVRPADVRPVLEDVARLIAPQAEAQSVRVSLDLPHDPLPIVPLDPGKFREALLNLVVNALEAMPGGGALTLRARPGGDAVVVEVADDGPGIPEEVRDDLFRPYVTTKPGGTGIGLALVEKLVSQHGGRVAFDSGPGGTSFRLTLPGATPDDPRGGPRP